MGRFASSAVVLAQALLVTVLCPSAVADNVVRIADQYGLAYLPLRVAVQHRLIEKHAAAEGVPGTRVEILQLGSGTATNDALISGNVDVAMAASPVLINLRDKTFGHNAVKGMMAIADSPIYFNTVDPRIKSVKDFTSEDRIAMTAGRGTIHAIILQMAAAQAFGWDERTRLDPLTVSMAHPDGVAALLTGGTGVKTHATTVPFIQMELAHPGVRTIFTSYDVVGGRHTFIVAYTTERWRRENSALYAATVAALTEAMTLIRQDTLAAAELYKRTEATKLGIDDIRRILEDENMIAYTPTPTKIGLFADYMLRTGLLKHKVASWKDVFFDNVHALPGN